MSTVEPEGKTGGGDPGCVEKSPEEMNEAKQGSSQPPTSERRDLEIAPSFPSSSRGLCFQF